MRAGWFKAEPPPPPASFDVGSQVVWEMGVGVAVFDQIGRLAYANPAFRKTQGFSATVGAEGYLVSPELESIRRQTLARDAATSPQPVQGGGDGSLTVQFIALGAARQWTALVMSAHGPTRAPSASDLSLQLLLHELRQPLLSAQESLEALTQATPAADPEIRAAVERQARAVGRLVGVIRGLSDLSLAQHLLQSGATWEMVDLPALVREVGDTFVDLALTRGLALEVDIEAPMPPVTGHRELLGRALSNLVDNALKYAAGSGQVRVSLRRKGSLAVAEVADDGPGIPLTQQAAIFTPFYRIPRSGQPPVPGVGLGLAVAVAVAEAHGGRIFLESSPGVGTTFRLTLLLGTPPPVRERHPRGMRLVHDRSASPGSELGPSEGPSHGS